jgi:hypothetical protein
VDDSTLVAYRARLEASAHRLAREHHVRRRRRFAWAAVIAAALLATATTLGATGVLGAWLGGKPAPAEVKRDFAGIRPELGHTPDPEATAEVAREKEVGVYATPTRQGGFCLVADDPALGFGNDGRGYCLRREEAKRPLVAGLIGGSQGSVVAGRARFDGAATIRLTDPEGNQVERPIGTGGFFVAVLVTGESQTCFDGKPWISTVVVLDREGSELARADFPFWVPARDTRGNPLRACRIMSPMSDEAAARIIRRERLR